MINKFIQLIISKIISNPNHSKFEYLEPKGDPGLFGPNSITWIVHKDFISMMIGGISSLNIAITSSKSNGWYLGSLNI